MADITVYGANFPSDVIRWAIACQYDTFTKTSPAVPINFGFYLRGVKERCLISYSGYTKKGQGEWKGLGWRLYKEDILCTIDYLSQKITDPEGNEPKSVAPPTGFSIEHFLPWPPWAGPPLPRGFSPAWRSSL